MILSELVTLYRRHVKRDAVKHGRATSTLWSVNAATRDLLDVVVRGDALHGRPATASATPPAELPQLDLLAQDLPGDGGEPIRRLADVEADDLTRDDLRNYLDHLLTKRHVRGKNAGKPWTLKHINARRADILRMFQWAERQRHVGESVLGELKRCPPLKPGKTIARRSEKITSADHNVIFELIDRLRATADQMPTKSRYQRNLQRKRRLLAVAAELHWELGCRPQELVLMRPCNVVPDPKDPDGWLYLPDEWKTEHAAELGEKRIMVVSHRAKELIDEAVVLRRTDGNQLLLTIADDFDPESRLFTWMASHPYNAVNGYYNALTRNLARLGLPHVTGLQVRHAFATRCVAVNPEGTRVQMGHKDLKTTMKYIDDDGPAVRKLFKQLDPNRTPPTNQPPTRPNGTDADDPGAFKLRLVGG